MTYSPLTTVVHGEAVAVDWGNQVKDNFEAGPRGIRGYAEVTANQGSIGGTFVALTGLSVSVAVPASRRIRVSAQVMLQVDTVGDTTAHLAILQGAGVVQGARHRPQTNSRSQTLTTSIVLTPAADTHTYSLSLRREVGTGTLTMSADTVNRAFILVEDIGAA